MILLVSFSFRDWVCEEVVSQMRVDFWWLSREGEPPEIHHGLVFSDSIEVHFENPILQGLVSGEDNEAQTRQSS